MGITASNGNQWAELDSDWDGPSGSLSGEPASVSMSQNVATIPGKTYKVSFDFMPRPNTSTGENGVEALHDGILGATATAPANSSWSNHSYTFVATGNSTNIAFRDSGTPSNSVGTMLDNTSVTCQPDSAPTTATIVATKVVCNTEAELPNWGAGGANITSTTAAEWVAQSDGQCHLATDWNFQWAPDGTSNPGNNVEHATGNWTTFGPTAGLLGQVTTQIPAGDLAWFREELKDGYVPFSGATSNLDDVASKNSAEMYCSSDVLNYDNYDFISPVVAGNTYYCVAFNAPVVPPTTTQCSDDVDNDGDQLVDANDPGCMSGPDNTYNPQDNDESNSSETPTDVCVNLEGDQSVVPEGYHAVGNQCVLDGAPACSDGIDNEGDGKIDAADPACHTDLNPDNSNSYVPSATSETNVDNTSSTNGGGGGGGGGGPLNLGGGGGGGGILGASTGQVLGASCGLYMDKHLRFGSKKNNKEQVTKLQQFLNNNGFGPIPVTGIFGPLTEAAVKALQAKYAENVLNPWNLSGPTGLVYLSTLRQINLLACPDLALQLPPLVPWSQNPNAQ